jgi:hypothetical protein
MIFATPFPFFLELPLLGDPVEYIGPMRQITLFSACRSILNFDD